MNRTRKLRTLLFLPPALLLLTLGVWLARGGSGAAARTPAAADRQALRPGHDAAADAGGETNAALPAKRGTKPRESAATEGPDDSFVMPEPLDGERPDMTRSRVRATVPADHSMVAGGHLLADGTREFAVMTPKRMEGSKAIEIEVDLLQLDPAGLAAAGLETLVNGDRKSEQNAELWTPEEVARTLGSMQDEARRAKPRVVTMPGEPARIRTGGFELELQATETADGGWDLRSELKRAE